MFKFRISKAVSNIILIILAFMSGGCQFEGGFSLHMEEAISLYEDRRHVYSEESQGLSDELFKRLLAYQRMLLPIARYVDWRAKRFNMKGVGIVRDDFVPMSGAGDIYDSIVPAQPWRAEAEEFAKSIFLALRGYHPSEFDAISDAAYVALHDISVFEQETQIYLPMLKHVLESLGLAALHAGEYSELTNGDTDKLAKDFLALQMRALSSQLITMDQLANGLHQLGIGVLINDLPPIPFENEYDQKAN